MIYAQATTEHGLRAKKYSCGRDGPSYDTASSEGPSPCNIRRRDARSCTQDVGNAFVFSPDALATVLALPLPRAAFRPHVVNCVEIKFRAPHAIDATCFHSRRDVVPVAVEARGGSR